MRNVHSLLTNYSEYLLATIRSYVQTRGCQEVKLWNGKTSTNENVSTLFDKWSEKAPPLVPGMTGGVGLTNYHTCTHNFLGFTRRTLLDVCKFFSFLAGTATHWELLHC
jgi:hypothetical protein